MIESNEASSSSISSESIKQLEAAIYANNTASIIEAIQAGADLFSPPIYEKLQWPKLAVPILLSPIDLIIQVNNGHFQSQAQVDLDLYAILTVALAKKKVQGLSHQERLAIINHLSVRTPSSLWPQNKLELFLSFKRFLSELCLEWMQDNPTEAELTLPLGEANYVWGGRSFYPIHLAICLDSKAFMLTLLERNIFLLPLTQSEAQDSVENNTPLNAATIYAKQMDNLVNTAISYRAANCLAALYVEYQDRVFDLPDLTKFIERVIWQSKVEDLAIIDVLVSTWHVCPTLFKFAEGASLLHVVVTHPNYQALAEHLLSTQKGMLNHYNDHGHTPLGLAIDKADISMVKALLAAGANPNLKVNRRLAVSRDPKIALTYLELAQGEPEIKALLLQAGANLTSLPPSVFATIRRGLASETIASSTVRLDVLSTLLTARIARDDFEPETLIKLAMFECPHSPLILVLMCNNPELLQQLFAKGATLAALGNTNLTEIACSNTCLEILRGQLRPLLQQAINDKDLRSIQALCMRGAILDEPMVRFIMGGPVEIAFIAFLYKNSVSTVKSVILDLLSRYELFTNFIKAWTEKHDGQPGRMKTEFERLFGQDDFYSSLVTLIRFARENKNDTLFDSLAVMLIVYCSWNKPGIGSNPVYVNFLYACEEGNLHRTTRFFEAIINQQKTGMARTGDDKLIIRDSDKLQGLCLAMGKKHNEVVEYLASHPDLFLPNAEPTLSATCLITLRSALKQHYPFVVNRIFYYLETVPTQINDDLLKLAVQLQRHRIVEYVLNQRLSEPYEYKPETPWYDVKSGSVEPRKVAYTQLEQEAARRVFSCRMLGLPPALADCETIHANKALAKLLGDYVNKIRNMKTAAKVTISSAGQHALLAQPVSSSTSFQCMETKPTPSSSGGPIL